MVAIERLSDPDEIKRVQALIYAHLENTESPRAGEILRHWQELVKPFWRVAPRPANAKLADEPALAPMEGRPKPATVDGFERGMAQLEFQTK